MSELIPIECEARLVGLSKQRRKDGDWIEVKFHIHPDDHPAALFILPLGTDCMLSVKGIEDAIGTTTQPLKGGERARRAGILCNDRDFQSYMKFIGEPEKCFPPDPPSGPMTPEATNARNLLLKNCFVSSMRLLDHERHAGEAFDAIVQQFYRTQRGEGDELVREQMR